MAIDDTRILQVWYRLNEDYQKIQGVTSIKCPHRSACSVPPSHSKCRYGWWRTEEIRVKLGYPDYIVHALHWDAHTWLDPGGVESSGEEELSSPDIRGSS